MPLTAAPVEPAPVVVQAQAETLYAAALADRRAGRHAAAAAGFEAVLSERPADVDARLYLGLSRLALDQLAAAQSAFEAVVRAAPDYVDAHLGLAEVARRRGDRAAADRALATARRLDPARAAFGGTADAEGAPVWRIDLDASRSELSQGLPDWTSERLAVSRRMDPSTGISLAIERTERFDLEDVYAEGRIDRRLGSVDTVLVVGGGPSADYRPRGAVSLGAGLGVGGGWTVEVQGTVARYRTGTVMTLQPGAAVTAAEGRLRLSARLIQVRDEQDRSRSGFGLGGVWTVHDRVRLFAGYADAPETAEGVTVKVQATSLGMEVDLSDRLLARANVVREDRGAYARSEVGFGLGVRF